MINKQVTNETLNLIADCDDRKTFGCLFSDYFAGLVSFSTTITRNRQVAEEVVVDVFVRLWDQRKMLKTIRNFQQYIYTATKYASINASKKNNAFSLTERFGDEFTLQASGNENPDNRLISKESLNKVSEAINTLPPRCRLIFRLIKEEGMKYDEVAELLELSVKTVENQMNIAFKKIFQVLNEGLPEIARKYERKKA